MKIVSMLNVGVCMALLCCSTTSLADDVSVEDFVGKVSAMNVAEIESGKLALEKSSSMDVKGYARKMIGEHSSLNNELRILASKKNMEIEDEASMSDKTKKFILEQRDGNSFDEAYADNEIKAHEDAIVLYKKGAKSADTAVRAFAVSGLLKIERHLELVKALSFKSTSAPKTTKIYNSYSSSNRVSTVN